MTRMDADPTIFGALVRSRDRARPGQRALTGLRHGNEWVELTYDELLRDVVTVSHHLAELGVGSGDVVCLVLPNWTEAVVYTYAVARLGAVVCPVTTIYRRRELAFIARRTACRVVVAPASYRRFDYAQMLRDVASDVPTLHHLICVGGGDLPGIIPSGSHLVEPGEAPAPPAHVDPDALAVLAFTSGTTGESKGVMHSHRSMHAAIDGFVGHGGLGDGLTSLVISPFGHLTGFTWGMLMPLRGAGDVVLLEAWDPERALDLIAQYSVSFTMGATPFLGDLLDAAAPRDSARFPDVFVCAGAPIPPSLIERAVREHACEVLSGWGMSEYPIGTSTAVGDDPVLASTSDGRPAAPAEVLVVDEGGGTVAIGEEGDVVIRGPGLFRGYYQRPDLDAEAVTADGYLRTGDRARLLDPAGHLRISGRTKDIIIRGGENIPVVEIENLLITHPAVKELAIVPVPDERLGETACACIVLRSGAQPVDVEGLGDFLRGHGVATQFFPESVRFFDELPRTPSGKIQKFALRATITDSATR
jgi:cyclohexanecarboxylate-CoA ligase